MQFASQLLGPHPNKRNSGPKSSLSHEEIPISPITTPQNIPPYQS